MLRLVISFLLLANLVLLKDNGQDQLYSDSQHSGKSNFIANGASLHFISNQFGFTEGPASDTKGNVYLTGNGVTIYNKGGELIEHIKVPEEWTSNITIGGKENNILFITASKSIYTLQLKVKGSIKN